MSSLLASLKARWLIYLYVLLNISFIGAFVRPLTFPHTTVGVFVATFAVTVGSVVLAVLPAYFVAGGVSGIIPMARIPRSIVNVALYIIGGIPSIVFGIVGFAIFSQALALGWSIASATLTLAMLLFPTLITAFNQILLPMISEFRPLNQSLRVTPLEFLFVMIPKMKRRELLACLILAWGRALGDTAAVMLTCGSLLETPTSLMDSGRVLSYHIYLLAMDTPGGMPEAVSLALLLIVTMLALQYVGRSIVRSADKDANSVRTAA